MTMLTASAAFLFAFVLGNTWQTHAEPERGSWIRRVSSAAARNDGGWLWGWAWGVDSTVSIVDRSPLINFASRPASFGPMFDERLLGYAIPMAAFTVPCPDSGRRHDAVPGRRSGISWIGSVLGYTTADTGSVLDVEIDAVPNLGCPKLCLGGKHEPESTDSWIAIVQRGKCQFVDKVREAQRFGARAVVVGGDDPETSGNPDALVNMYSQGDSSDVEIPSTFIKYSDYMRLSHLIATSNTSTSGMRTVSLQIIVDYSSWEWYSPILTFIVLLLLPSSITLVTLLIHRVRLSRAARRERAPEEVVNNLPWRVWTGKGWEKHEGPVPPNDENVTVSKPSSYEFDLDLENGGGAPGTGMEPCHPSTSHGDDAPWFEAQTECAICLCEFVKGDRVRVLPCKHIFHLQEVDEWLIHRKKLCPVCKADVTQPHPPPHPHPQPQPPPHSTSGEDSPPAPRQPSQASDATENTPLLVPTSHSLDRHDDSLPEST